MLENKRDATFQVALISNNIESGFSEITEGRIKVSSLMSKVFYAEHQSLKPGVHRDAHNAEPDEIGPITHILMINEGAVSIGVGKELKQKYFEKGWVLCFTDEEGKGHSSRVSTYGCERTYMRAAGHLQKGDLLPKT